MALSVLVNGVERASYVRPESLTVTSKGYAGTGTCTLELLDPPTVPNPEDILEVRDGSTTIFEGPIRVRSRGLTDTRPVKKVVKLGAQDLTSLLTDDVVEIPNVRSTAETDAARIVWLVTTFGTKSVTAVIGGSGFVVQVYGGNLPPQDFGGLTLFEAIEEVCKLSGARFYVDHDYKLHYFATETQAAPFALSDTPNGTTTFGYKDLELPDDTVELTNAYYVIGSDAVTPIWVPDTSLWPTSSHTTYGRREGVIRDGSLDTAAKQQAAGEAALAATEVPKGPASLVTYKAGLRAGMHVDLTNATWGITWTDRPITEVEASLVKGTITTLEYRVTLDDAPVSLAGYLANVDRKASNALFAGETAVGAGVDTSAPATPTGLALSSSVFLAPDGTSSPVLLADWNDNGEADLSAYELQAEPALEGEVAFTATGSTGGSLATGTYQVIVTGVGAHGGETYRSAVKSVAVTGPTGRIVVTITAKAGCTSYRIFASVDSDPLFAQSTTTTGSGVNVNTAGAGVTAPNATTAIGFVQPSSVRTSSSSARLDGIIGGVYYGARVRAIDQSGNASGWSSVATTTSAGDLEAPDVPQGLAAVPGFRLAGVTWNRSDTGDLDRYELRWTAELGSSGLPDTGAWTKGSIRSTFAVVQDLEPDTLYFFQVRAIDRSGNVATSVQDPTPLEADANPEAGWSNTAAALTGGGSTTLAAAASAGATNLKVTSITGFEVGNLVKIGTVPEFRVIVTVGTAGSGGTGITVDAAIDLAKGNGEAFVAVVDRYVTAEPSKVGQADLAANSVTANAIQAGAVTADKMTAGNLTLGGVGNALYLTVLSSTGTVIGTWDNAGLLLIDPTNTARRVRWVNGRMEFSADSGASWSTGIDGQGIYADAIRLGTEGGGHNRIPNAGFELSSFAATLSKVWTATTDWDDATSAVNLSTGGASLALTTATF